MKKTWMVLLILGISYGLSAQKTYQTFLPYFKTSNAFSGALDVFSFHDNSTRVITNFSDEQERFGVGIYSLNDTGVVLVNNAIYDTFTTRTGGRQGGGCMGLDSNIYLYGTLAKYLKTLPTFGSGILYKVDGQTLDTIFTHSYDSLKAFNSVAVVQPPWENGLDSSLYLLGVFTINQNNSDIKLSRVSKKGEVVWEKDFLTNEIDVADFMSEDYNYDDVSPWRAVVLSMYSRNVSYSFQGRRYDSYLLTIDTGGGISYIKQPFHTLEYQNVGQTIKHYPNGGGLLYVVTETDYYLDPQFINIMKLNNTGEQVIWKTTFRPPYNQPMYFWNATILSNGEILVVGSYPCLNMNGVSGRAAWMCKLDADGNRIWEKLYWSSNIIPTLPVYHYLNDVSESADHCYVAVGQAPNGERYDAWVLKVDSNGCMGTNCGQAVNSLYTGIKEDATSVSLNIRSYPNPTVDVFTLDITTELLSQNKNLVLEVVDILGTKILEQKISDNKTNISLLEKAAGIYTYRLSSNGTLIHTDKIIKL